MVTLICDCNQIHFASGKTKHRWPSAFLFELPYTVLGMNSSKVAESNGQCQRDNDKGVGSDQVVTVMNIHLLVFRTAALSNLTEERRDCVWLLRTLLHSVAEGCSCSFLCFLPDYTVSFPRWQPSQNKDGKI